MKWKIIFIVITVVLAIGDIYSKHVVFEHFSVMIPDKEDAIPRNMWEMYPGVFVPPDYERIAVIDSFFYIAVVLNRGAVWGIMQGEKLILTSISVVAILFIMYLVFFRNTGKFTIPLALITSGAIGNLWDRVIFSGVRDFLDFYIGTYHWPTFNLADCFIVVGVISYCIIDLWFNPQEKQEQEEKNEPQQKQPKKAKQKKQKKANR